MSLTSPPLRPFARGDVRAQTSDEAARFDGRAIEKVGVPQPVLMENAGRAAASLLHRLYGTSSVVGIVGSGNNGGDALVALRTLAAWGHDVRAVVVADRSEEDALLHGWSLGAVADSTLDASGWGQLLERADVVIDGILGTGTQGAPRTRQAEAIVRINESGRPVVALDVPSGIDASSGEVPGEAIRAELTVSFGAPKIGALLHPGRAYVGRHVNVEIGFPPLADTDASVLVATPGWARARLPVRETDTHKNRVGRVLVVGGALGMAGAIILAGRAAFSAGAGLVRICSSEANREAIQAAIPEAIFVSAEDEDDLADAIQASDAVAVGPGLGTSASSRDLLARVTKRTTQPLLLDADALNLLAEDEIGLARLGEACPVLITPHPGEMARLNGAPSDRSRVEVARDFAASRSCAVLLKGAPSVVASREGEVTIDTQSSSDLAVAGMGDALSGACAALMAQGLDPATAGAVGLYLSGRAAVLADRGAGLTPSEVVQRIPDVLSERADSSSDLDLPFVTFDADAAR